MREIDIAPGRSIRRAAEQAIAEAIVSGEAVRFSFNGTVVEVLPDDDAASVIDRYARSRGGSREDRAKAVFWFAPAER